MVALYSGRPFCANCLVSYYILRQCDVCGSWKVISSSFFQSLKQVHLRLLSCGCSVKSLAAAVSIHSVFKSCCGFAPQMIIVSPIPWKIATLTYLENSYQHRKNHSLISLIWKRRTRVYFDYIFEFLKARFCSHWCLWQNSHYLQWQQTQPLSLHNLQKVNILTLVICDI